ncbi:hypothetical protein [Winogradskyella flava]|uniref:hypothetical protein n=1 Tax=Winogradskyella flava TaxID=1884876 RepID=UPI0024901028|nr:hypothetical protein [Winogradskyella flava]
MKKHLKFLVLAPCLFAVLCEEDDLVCGYSEPETYTLNIENISEVYPADETIWLNAETSALLFDICDEDEELEAVDNPEQFASGMFILKLNSELGDLNAEIAQDYSVGYTLGEGFNIVSCLEAITVIPVLSADNQTYNYRLGLSVSTPGDYCIVNTFNNNFNIEGTNNSDIFGPYNTLDNRIRFQNCEDIFTRTGTEGHFFFSVE